MQVNNSYPVKNNLIAQQNVLLLIILVNNDLLQHDKVITKLFFPKSIHINISSFTEAL